MMRQGANCCSMCRCPSIYSCNCKCNRLFCGELRCEETEDLKQYLQVQPSVFTAAFPQGTVLQVQRKVCCTPLCCMFQLHPPAWLARRHGRSFITEGCLPFHNPPLHSLPFHGTMQNHNGNAHAKANGYGHGSAASPGDMATVMTRQ